MRNNNFPCRSYSTNILMQKKEILMQKKSFQTKWRSIWKRVLFRHQQMCTNMVRRKPNDYSTIDQFHEVTLEQPLVLTQEKCWRDR